MALLVQSKLLELDEHMVDMEYLLRVWIEEQI